MMNEEKCPDKQPLILEKIMLIDKKIENLFNILSPVIKIPEEPLNCVEATSCSITIERLSNVIDKLDTLTRLIDIN